MIILRTAGLVLLGLCLTLLYYLLQALTQGAIVIKESTVPLAVSALSVPLIATIIVSVLFMKKGSLRVFNALRRKL
jgi:hypothetical protein